MTIQALIVFDKKENQFTVTSLERSGIGAIISHADREEAKSIFEKALKLALVARQLFNFKETGVFIKGENYAIEYNYKELLNEN